MATSPTVPPPQPQGLNRVLSRNIEELRRRRAQEREHAGAQQRVAAAITGFVGTMPFAYLHVVIIAAWTVINLGLIPGVALYRHRIVTPFGVGVAAVSH